jgi:hypothetical protein
MRVPPSLSLRSKFILIVLGGAVLPLALLGLWLTRTAERSGEHLLRARLRTSLSQVVDEVGLRWLSDAVESAAIHDRSGSTRWALAADDAAVGRGGRAPEPVLPVSLGIYDNASGRRLGTLETRVTMSGLLPGGAGWGGVLRGAFGTDVIVVRSTALVSCSLRE